MYETKAPYSKPVKVKRKRTTTVKSGIIDAPLSNVHSAPNGLASATNVDTNTNSGASAIVKKRKRKNSDSSQGGSLSTTSEDEVMPTASTTRARGAARQTRGVSLKDILIDENEPVVSKHAAHRAKSSRPDGMESGSEVRWGYSQIVDGREVWHHVDEENLRQMLFPAQNASQEPKPPLVEGQAQASALENGTPNGYSYAQEEKAVTMPMPKWQVLTLPSLMHACRESMRHRQQQRTSTPTTTSLQYTASASSNATVPIRPSPTDFGKVANRLQAASRTSITPVPMAKVESANGSLPPEGAPNTLPY